MMTIEDTTKKRKKLIFRSWHRGTQEMDLIMGKFADDFIPDCSDEALDQYEELLNEPDPDIYNWVCGREDVPANKHSPVIQALLDQYPVGSK